MKMPAKFRANNQLLTDNEETLVERYFISICRYGLPVAQCKNKAKRLIREIIKSSGKHRPIRANAPSEKWFEGFFMRHPNIEEKAEVKPGKSDLTHPETIVVDHLLSLLETTKTLPKTKRRKEPEQDMRTPNLRDSVEDATEMPDPDETLSGCGCLDVVLPASVMGVCQNLEPGQSLQLIGSSRKEGDRGNVNPDDILILAERESSSLTLKLMGESMGNIFKKKISDHWKCEITFFSSPSENTEEYTCNVTSPVQEPAEINMVSTLQAFPDYTNAMHELTRLADEVMKPSPMHMEAAMEDTSKMEVDAEGSHEVFTRDEGALDEGAVLDDVDDDDEVVHADHKDEGDHDAAVDEDYASNGATGDDDVEDDDEDAVLDAAAAGDDDDDADEDIDDDDPSTPYYDGLCSPVGDLGMSPGETSASESGESPGEDVDDSSFQLEANNLESKSPPQKNKQILDRGNTEAKVASNECRTVSKTSKKQHVCPHCGDVFPFMCRLLIHVNTKHYGMKHKKSKKKVNKATDDSNPKEKPAKSTENAKYCCEKCGESFTIYQRFKYHKQKHANKTAVRRGVRNPRKSYTYPCETCGKVCPNKATLTVHKRVHTGEKPFPCAVCERRFATKPQLKAHSGKHTGERPYVCSYCGKAFRFKAGMVQHSYSHTGETPHVCKICGKGFTSTGALASHRRVHSTDTPFKCSYCEQGFKYKATYDIHVMRHTGDFTHTCSYCGKNFRYISTYRYHVRLHTGEKPYSCSICGKGFHKRSLVTRHERIHTGEKPFPCQMCGERFARHEHRKAHIVKQSCPAISETLNGC